MFKSVSLRSVWTILLVSIAVGLPGAVASGQEANVEVHGVILAVPQNFPQPSDQARGRGREVQAVITIYPGAEGVDGALLVMVDPHGLSPLVIKNTLTLVERLEAADAIHVGRNLVVPDLSPRSTAAGGGLGKYARLLADLRRARLGDLPGVGLTRWIRIEDLTELRVVGPQ